LLALALVTTAHAGFNTCGDMNNDGYVNAVDALVILQADAGLTAIPAPAFEIADTNDDGAVNSRDALFVLQYDAGLVEQLGCVF
jgi:hypothetical protein